MVGGGFSADARAASFSKQGAPMPVVERIPQVDEEARASVLEQIDTAFLEAKAELEDERKKLEEEGKSKE